jgi:hypothetical protein
MATDPLIAGFRAMQQQKSGQLGGTPAKGNSGGSAILAAARNTPSPTPAPPVHKDWWEQTQEVLGKAADTPVIKQLLNALGTGMYAAGNVSNDTLDAQKNLQDAANSGDFRKQLSSAIDVMGGPAETFKAIGEGVLGGLGNEDFQKSQSQAISKVQERAGIDPTSSASKWVSGLGGFAGDVAFDPLNFVDGIGVIPAAVKGATRGALTFKAENALSKVAKDGEGLAEGVAPTRWENVKQEANKDIAAYHDKMDAAAQLKATNKSLKGADDAAKAQYLVGNITTLHPAVAKALHDGIAKKNPGALLDAVKDIPTDKLDELVSKVAPDAEKIPKNIPVEEPASSSVSLSQFKAPTKEEQIFNELDKFRGTTKNPAYTPQVIKSIEDLRAARPDKIEKLTERPAVAEAMTETNKVPDIKATIKSLKDFDREMGGDARIPTIGNAGKKVYTSVDDLIPTLDPRDSLFKQNWDAVKDFQVYKAPEPARMPPLREMVTNPKALKDKDYEKFGIAPDHIALIRNGTPIKDLVHSDTTGDLKTVLDNISNGTIPQSALKGFYDHVGTEDPKEISKILGQIIDTPAFKETADKFKDYGSVRRGLPEPELGVSGHSQLGVPGKGFTEDDILASKTPANPNQTRKYLEAVYSQSAMDLASHTRGPELRAVADAAFQGTIDEQMRPAGSLVAKGGASVREDLKAAKYEKLYNTHSGMWRMKYLINEARNMKFSSRSAQDKAFMTMLKDVDDRLRLAGFDQHLSNMQEVGDKLIVRLSPSDVLGAMTQAARIKYIHGNQRFVKGGGQINEVLPTMLLDLGEVLTRSATKLTPEGNVDWVTMVNKAMHTLQGRYSEVAGGKRVIIHNLDAATKWKNDTEILREVDKLTVGKSNYYKKFVATKVPAERQSIIDAALSLHPEQFRKAEEARLGSTVNDLIAMFTKGMKDGKPSIVSQLINTNMRNAALMGGTVAKPIGEASEEFSRSVLDSLESGTVAQHLSALVAKPPFQTTDVAAKEALRENATDVVNTVATPEEMKHANALKSNLNSATREEAAKVNANAYQQTLELAQELAKPAKEMNPDIIFDLSFREINRDLLYRMYGTSRWFNKRTGMSITFDKLTSSLHAGPALLTGYNGILRDMRRSGYTGEQLRVAFNDLKKNGPHDQLTGELDAVLRTMFDTDKTNFLARNSVGPDHFNKVLESVKFDERFRVDPKATTEEMSEAWKKWDVTDVQDFFSKMMAAMVKTANDVSMGASFSKNFGKAAWEPGYVKIVDKSGMNDFSELIDKSLFYPKEVAQEMVHINRMMSESRSFKPGDHFYTFVNKIMDPIISNLKMTQTTLRPGHHVMSIIGDTWRNNLALTTIGYANPVKQTKLYGEAYRIMQASLGDIEELSNFANFQRLQKITGEMPIAERADSGFEYYPNIKGGGRVNRQDLYDIATARGVALPAHLGGMAEDYLTNFDDFTTFGEHATNKVVGAIQKITEGLDRLANPIKPKLGMKNPYSLNKFTSNRDTFTRLPLFLGAMRSRNFKSLEEAVDYASDFVRKWSPTAQDLGAGESKYVRRAIFYYTWTRGMIPRIVESAIAHPGVAITPYKAAYSLAVANGLDPKSIGDPFPPNLVLPDWYSQRVIGPQFKSGGWLSSNSDDLWGINPTGPLGDLLNQFGADTKPKDFTSFTAFQKTVGVFGNMSTPFIKAPAEIGMGRTLQGDVPITDPNQYLQDMVGPARQVSRLTGHELYPTVHDGQLDFAKRTESKYANMTPDQQAHNTISELINYGSGLGLTSYTDNSTKKSAQFQQKDAKVQAKKEQARFK